MKQVINRCLYLFLFFLLPVSSLYGSFTPVNPQPGQNIWHITAAIGTELDQMAVVLNANSCCATTFTAIAAVDRDVLIVSSKIDALTNIVNLDFNNTFTALDACCTTINSNISLLTNIVNVDFNGTFTALQQVDNDVLTVSSKIDACCSTLVSLIDNISTSSGITCPSPLGYFQQTWTILQQIDNDVLTVSSKVDALSNLIKFDFNSTFTAINALSNLVTNEFNGTFTALNACCFTLNSKVDVANTSLALNFPLIESSLGLVDNDVVAVANQVNVVESQVSAITQVCSWTGAVGPTPITNTTWDSAGTTVGAVSWNRTGNQLAVGGGQGTPANALGIYGFNGSFLSPIAATGSGQSTTVNSVHWSLDGQYIAAASTATLPGSYNLAIYNALSLKQITTMQVVTASTGSSVAWRPGGTFLAMADQSGNVSILSFTNLTLSLITTVNPASSGSIYVSWSPDGSYLAVVRGTTLSIYQFSGGSSLTLRQSSAISSGVLNSVHWSSNEAYIATGDSNGVVTVAAYNTVTNTISTLTTVTETQAVNAVRWSAGSTTLAVGLAAIDGLGNDLYVYSFTPNTLTQVSALAPQTGGSVNALSWTPSLSNCQQYLATAGFASGTNPNITIYGSSITTTPGPLITSFNGTFTTLAAGFACGATPLYQSNVTNGALILTTSCANYCLSQPITGSIIIAASNVNVDLNQYCLIGTFSVLGSVSDIEIHNGKIEPAAPANSLDAANAAIAIAATAKGVLIKDCHISCAANTLSSGIGRDGIDNAGLNTIIDNCFIKAGDGGASTVAGFNGGAGGTGINNTGSDVGIKNSSIFLSNGGNGFLSTFFAYVVNTNGAINEVIPVNLSTNALGSPITVDDDPFQIAIAPNGATAYVTINNANSGTTVQVISISSNTVVGAIGVGTGPEGIAITPDGTVAVVANFASRNVSIITLSNNSVVTSAVSSVDFPLGVAITPDSKTAYVTNFLGGTVTPITIAGFIIGSTIGVGSSPQAIAITPNGQFVYVTNSASASVSVISTASNLVVANIGVGNRPDSIVITPDGTKAYVANANDGTVTPITIATNTAGTPITVGGLPSGISITPDGKTVYVATGSPSNSIVPITVATNTVGTAITGFTTPITLAITPANGGTGGNGIVQQASYGQLINNSIIGSSTGATGSTAGNGVVVAATAFSNLIQDCDVLNGYYGFSLVNTSTLFLTDCIAQSCSNNGFNINGSADIRAINCTAQGCAVDGFTGANSCVSVTIEHCTATNNTSNGFNFSTAGSCCSVGDSFATSNNLYGYLGNGANVVFYNNFANCNGTNFDSNSASSAISGKLDSKIDLLTALINLDFNGTFTVLQQIDNDVLTVSSKVDALTNLINFDFNGTFTAINALSNLVTNEFNGTFTALNACCTTINSSISALTNIINADFNGTFTTLAALSTLITNDFNGTYTGLMH